MKTLTITGGVDIAYEDDYFGPAWVEPSVCLLVHGIAESGRAWTQWIPVLAAELRVIRIDLPGFGESSMPEASFDWSPRGYSDLIADFVRGIGMESFHLISAKYGGKISMQFAAMYPDLVRSLQVFSSPARAPGTDTHHAVKAQGLREWSAATMRRRLGSTASEDQVNWWTEMHARSNVSSVIGCTSRSNSIDISDDLPNIVAPTLVVTTTRSGLQDVAEVRRYQGLIPHSQLVVLDGDCYHPAAVEPVRCASMALDFIKDVEKRMLDAARGSL